MKIKVTDIEYDLFDEETNPNNEITAADFELPTSFIIEQEMIDKAYGEDFDKEADLADLISCHTGFCIKSFSHEVIS